ncbi:MAG: peroxidase-related enzyme [Planctomycetaceae bacterium]
MRAHADDFRSEGGDEATAAALEEDYRDARLAPRARALCEFAARVTLTPQSLTAADLAPLHAAGLTDPEIHDATQVIAYFNYINRIADALGTDPEPSASL